MARIATRPWSLRCFSSSLVRLSTDEESVEARNNVVFVTAAGTSLAILVDAGSAVLADNWLPTGWRSSHSAVDLDVQDLGNVTGASPGFTGAGDYTLAPGSPCIGAAGPLAPATSAHPVLLQMASPRDLVGRPWDGAPDIGAFER
jgi:hypothetical protein